MKLRILGLILIFGMLMFAGCTDDTTDTTETTETSNGEDGTPTEVIDETTTEEDEEETDLFDAPEYANLVASGEKVECIVNTEASTGGEQINIPTTIYIHGDKARISMNLGGQEMIGILNNDLFALKNPMLNMQNPEGKKCDWISVSTIESESTDAEQQETITAPDLSEELTPDAECKVGTFSDDVFDIPNTEVVCNAADMMPVQQTQPNNVPGLPSN